MLVNLSKVVEVQHEDDAVRHELCQYVAHRVEQSHPEVCFAQPHPDLVFISFVVSDHRKNDQVPSHHDQVAACKESKRNEQETLFSAELAMYAGGKQSVELLQQDHINHNELQAKKNEQ